MLGRRARPVREGGVVGSGPALLAPCLTTYLVSTAARPSSCARSTTRCRTSSPTSHTPTRAPGWRPRRQARPAEAAGTRMAHHPTCEQVVKPAVSSCTHCRDSSGSSTTCTPGLDRPDPLARPDRSGPDQAGPLSWSAGTDTTTGQGEHVAATCSSTRGMSRVSGDILSGVKQELSPVLSHP